MGLFDDLHAKKYISHILIICLVYNNCGLISLNGAHILVKMIFNQHPLLILRLFLLIDEKRRFPRNE